MESRKTRESSVISFTLGNKLVEEGWRERQGQREGGRKGRRGREGRGRGEAPPVLSFIVIEMFFLKYTSDLGRLVFHIHYAGVKSNFILLCLVRWSIVHMTFCNMMQHKAINHTESE